MLYGYTISLKCSGRFLAEARMRGICMLMVYQGSCGWWYVSLDNQREFAKFRYRADAQIFAVCCYEAGYASRVTLASGAVI